MNAIYERLRFVRAISTHELNKIFLQKITFKIRDQFLSRDLSIDSELLQLQRGASGDPSTDEPDGDEVHRR